MKQMQLNLNFQFLSFERRQAKGNIVALAYSNPEGSPKEFLGNPQGPRDSLKNPDGISNKESPMSP